ncbi:uracil-DNA glycosylase [Trametopsis cervina]|nr:uracil-DNA glycosylase [Trametopsis cervina]
MAEQKSIVYLEDLETPTSSQATEAAGDKPAKVASKTTTKASTKRQASLMDMFSGAGAQSIAKKRKIEKSSVSTTEETVSPPATLAPPKPGQTLNSIPFSLSAYVQSLSEDQRRLLALECDTMGKSWLKVLKDEIKKPYFLKLKQFLWDQGVRGAEDSAQNLKVYPAPQNVYSWSNLTPLGRVKVVIIGQDPYHGPKQAHGLCFSVPHGVQVPPSLRNIYKEIKDEYPEFVPPKHGNLTGWAQNGVLLLNTCLTVKANEAGSHSGKGWEEFTDRVVDIVDKYGGANLAAHESALAGRGRGIVFLAWGAWAAKRVAKLNKKKHLILTSAHPSPLSASRGFLGNGHFKQANEWLEEKYGADGCVDWCSLATQEE